MKCLKVPITNQKSLLMEKLVDQLLQFIECQSSKFYDLLIYLLLMVIWRPSILSCCSGLMANESRRLMGGRVFLTYTAGTKPCLSPNSTFHQSYKYNSINTNLSEILKSNINTVCSRSTVIVVHMSKVTI